MSSTQLPQVSTWRPETRACLYPKEAHSWSGRPEEKVPKHILWIFLSRGSRVAALCDTDLVSAQVLLYKTVHLRVVNFVSLHLNVLTRKQGTNPTVRGVPVPCAHGKGPVCPLLLWERVQPREGC